MRASDWDPIRGSHHGQRPKRLQQQAEYMTAPDHSRKRQIPLAPRAPSIHGTQENLSAVQQLSLLSEGTRDIAPNAVEGPDMTPLRNSQSRCSNRRAPCA